MKQLYIYGERKGCQHERMVLLLGNLWNWRLSLFEREKRETGRGELGTVLDGRVDERDDASDRDPEDTDDPDGLGSRGVSSD